MKKNGQYTLQLLRGVPYLLPFGQNVADQRRGVRLDDTGVFLWHALDQVKTREELLERFLAYSGAGRDDTARAREDLEQFIATLSAWGILLPDPQPREPHHLTLRIGPLTLNLLGKSEYYSPEFDPFALAEAVSPDTMDQTVVVTRDSPPPPTGARIVLRNRELTVCEGEDGWFLFYPQAAHLGQVALTRDGSRATFYVNHFSAPQEAERLRYDLFHAIRLSFLYLAQRRGCFALHSASILYRDRAWLFSGPSGTGKSTQADLWRETFGVICLNGDLNLLSLADDRGIERPGKVFVHGLPWRGTSGISTVGQVELGGIILLRQGTENRLEFLTGDQKQLLVMNRLISPSWTAGMVETNLAFTGALAGRVPVWRYHCTKETSAAEFLREHIDQIIGENAE